MNLRRDWHITLAFLLVFVLTSVLGVATLRFLGTQASLLARVQAEQLVSGLLYRMRQADFALDSLPEPVEGFALYGPDGQPLTHHGNAPEHLDEKARSDAERSRAIVHDHGVLSVAFRLGDYPTDPDAVLPASANRPLLPRAFVPPPPEAPAAGPRNSGGIDLVLDGIGVSANRDRSEAARGSSAALVSTQPPYVYLAASSRMLTERLELYRTGALAIPVTFLFLVSGLWFVVMRNREFQRTIAENARLVELGEASRTISHEIKNPLSAMRIQTALLRRAARDPGISSHLDVIDSEIGRLADLSSRISTTLRNPTGRPKLLAICPWIREHTGRRRPDLTIEAPDSSPQICMDEDHLRSVLDNILNNAIESGSPADTVKLAVIPRGRRVEIRITDRGSGLPRVRDAKLFDPFYTTKSSGSGIGLSLSRRFVEGAGGRITLRRRQGGGTQVSIRLPVAGEGPCAS